jgi:threonine/homoserine/homoserine lactone efflux protein
MSVGALAMFAFVSSITPGPNNVMLWASGLNFGFRRTLRHIAGVNIGFMSLLVATALGLGALFETVEWLAPGLRIAGSAYLLYLAYRVATAGRTEQRGTARPMTFLEAVAFQYVNPKAWVMGLTAAGAFLPGSGSLLAGAAVLAAVFGLVNLPCISAWAAAGTAIGRLLTNPRRRRIINGFLGLLLVATVYLINA